MQDLHSEKDEELLKRAKGGETAATEELLRRYMRLVRARARCFFLDGMETEDLVQEGMIGLLGAISGYDPACGKSFKNFAYLCVTRRIYDLLRAAGRRQEDTGFDPDTVSVGETPEELLLDGESRAEFRMKLLKELSDFEFRIVTMYLDGMSYAQMCEATGKDAKSIDNALARSKRKLQRAFAARKE